MKLRTFAATLVIGSFISMAATGIGLFLHIRTGFIKPIHELSGILFVIGGLLHVIANRHAIANYLKKKPILAIGIAFFAIAIFAFAPLSKGKGDAWHAVMKESPALLLNLNAQELGIVTHKGASEILSQMRKAGIQADSTLPVGELAKKSKADAGAFLLRAIREEP